MGWVEGPGWQFGFRHRATDQLQTALAISEMKMHDTGFACHQSCDVRFRCNADHFVKRGLAGSMVRDGQLANPDQLLNVNNVGADTARQSGHGHVITPGVAPCTESFGSQGLQTRNESTRGSNQIVRTQQTDNRRDACAREIREVRRRDRCFVSGLTAATRDMVPLFHGVTFGILFLTFIGALYHLFQTWGEDTQYVASLIAATNLGVLFLFYYARAFPLRAQDRIIKLEESLRAHRLTGSDLDPRLTMKQVIGLRFASDAEWPDLARRAAEKGLDQKQIKEAVTQWRADDYRV